MKKSIIFIITINLLLVFTSKAQQLSQYSMFMYNNILHNPAFLGSKNCTELRLGYRDQWRGYEGNPKSVYGSVNHIMKIKKKPYLKSKHGIGGYVEQDNLGLSSQTNIQLGYAYHAPVGKGMFLAGGLYLGVKQFSVSLSSNLAPDNSDPALNGGGFTWIYPDASAGLLFYNKKYYIGAAMKSIFGNRLQVYGSTAARLRNQFNIMGGYSIQANRSLVIMPQALIKIQPGAPVAVDISAMFLLYRIDLGLGVRAISSIDALTALVNIQVLPRWSVGYAYDLPLSKINKVTFQTHEITTAFKLCPNRDLGFDREECPAYSN